MIPVIYFSVGRVITYLRHTRGGGGGVYSFFCRKLEEGIKKIHLGLHQPPPPPPPL